jgi:hypothetical protein
MNVCVCRGREKGKKVQSHTRGINFLEIRKVPGLEPFRDCEIIGASTKTAESV